jgi:hypothetical protein
VLTPVYFFIDFLLLKGDIEHMKSQIRKIKWKYRLGSKRRIAATGKIVVDRNGEVHVEIVPGIKRKIRLPQIGNEHYKVAGYLRNSLPILESSFEGTQFTPEQLEAALNNVFTTRTTVSHKQAH